MNKKKHLHNTRNLTGKLQPVSFNLAANLKIIILLSADDEKNIVIYIIRNKMVPPIGKISTLMCSNHQ